jgi:hypothetical protein
MAVSYHGAHVQVTQSRARKKPEFRTDGRADCGQGDFQPSQYVHVRTWVYVPL